MKYSPIKGPSIEYLVLSPWHCIGDVLQALGSGAELEEKDSRDVSGPTRFLSYREMNLSVTAAPQRQTETSNIVNLVNLSYF